MKYIVFMFVLVGGLGLASVWPDHMCPGCGGDVCDGQGNGGPKKASLLGSSSGGLGYTGMTIVDLVESGTFDAWLATKNNPSELCIILYMCFKHNLLGAFRTVLKNPYFQEFPLYSAKFDESVTLCPMCGKSAKAAIDELLKAILSLNTAYFIPRRR